MATTATDIITDAFLKLGVYSPGDSIADQDAERALTILNDMLDSWSNESLSCFAITEQSVVLTVNKQTYTIGSGGDANVTRPLRLIEGDGAGYIQDSNSNNYPLEIITQAQWNMIGNRGSTAVQSNVPLVLFYDPQFPLGKLNFYPTPNVAGYTAFWDSYLQLTDFSSLSATFSFPTGYKKAMQDNLAVEMQPYFADSQLNPMVLESARKSKANIKRTNARIQDATFDQALIIRGQGTYNIYTDNRNGTY